VSLTHLDAAGRARMVDVSAKPETDRVAMARATVFMMPATADLPPFAPRVAQG